MFKCSKLKNNLDERQEQAMLKIEHNGCWIAFWGLFIILVVEYIIFGYQDLRAIAGEWVIFMILAFYLAVDCTRKGIFDRRLKPTTGTIIACGVIGGIIAALIFGAVQYRRYPEFPGIAAALSGIIGVITCALIIFSLVISAKSIKKQEEKGMSEYADENEE